MLLQVSSGSWDIRAEGYDDTSSRLVKALRKVVSVHLIERLEIALKLRHSVVRGFFVDGNFVKNRATRTHYDFVVLKMSRRASALERDAKGLTVDALRWLAQEFWGIEEELERLHSDALYRKVTKESD